MFALMDQTQGTLIYLKILAFGNTFQVDTNVRINKTLSRDSKLKKQSYFPNHNIFGFRFSEVSDNQTEAYKDFIEDFAAEPIWIFDTTDTWRFGFIQEDEIPIATDKDVCSHSFSFTFLEIEPPAGSTPTFTPPPDPESGAAGIGLYSWFTDGATSPVKTEEFIPGSAGTWTAKADFPSPATINTGSAPLQGKVFAFGGNLSGGSPNAVNDTHFYIPSAGLPGTWSSGPDMPSGNAKVSALGLNIKGIVYSINGGGRDVDQVGDQSFTKDVLSFDGAWTVLNRPPMDSNSVAGASIDGFGYVVGGATVSFTAINDTRKYDATADSWISQLDYTLNIKTVADFYDDKMVAVGGVDQIPVLKAQVGVFTPNKFTPGTWATGSAMPPEPDSDHSVCFYKPTGTLFKIGGAGIAINECYELQGGPSGSWVQKADSNNDHNHDLNTEAPFGDPSA